MEIKKKEPHNLGRVDGSEYDTTVAMPQNNHSIDNKDVLGNQIHIPKIRNLTEAYREIINDDPETSICFNSLRHAVITGKIPSVKIGQRYLIDMMKIYAYYSCGLKDISEEDQGVGSIRHARV